MKTMRVLRLLLPVGAIICGLLFTSGVTFATKEMGKKEKKPCNTCHVKAGKKDLNNVGQYYKEKKTLDGAPAPAK
jgi:hypothetical protein